MGYRHWSIERDMDYMKRHGGKIKNYSRLMNFKFKWKYSIPIMWLYGFRKRKTNDKNDIDMEIP